MSEFNKVAEYKINTQKSPHFYILIINVESKIKNTIPFTITPLQKLNTYTNT